MAGAYDYRGRERPDAEPMTEQIRRGRQEAQDLAHEASDVAGDLGVLIQQEVRLAKAELQGQVSRATQSAVAGAAAGAFGMVMLIFLFASFMLTLNLALPLWISAYITAGILAILVGVAGLIAFLRLKQVNLAPTQTIESVKVDVEWARHRMQSGGR